MDDQPHPSIHVLPTPIEPSISEKKVSSTEAMATDDSTANPEPSVSLDHEDNGEVTGEDSFVSAQELPFRIRECPPRSDAEDSKDLEMAEKNEPQNLETEDSTKEPFNTTDQATLDQAPNEVDAQGTYKPSYDEKLPEENVHPAGEEKPEDAACDTNDDFARANAPRVGFKHNPAEEAIMANVELDVSTSQKKKKKKRPKSKRGLNAPTGFEPFYADAPLTPQEFEENKSIYDPALPILDRIDEGIKRFLFKRRLEPHRRKVFLKYLQYGGVTVGQNPNQGVTPQELKGMDKEEAMQARSNTIIYEKPGRTLPISFNDVATGYLTGFFMGHYNPDSEEEIKICTGTMKNFFTYLLHHNVCPEQTEDLEEARRTCDRCEKELWMTQQLIHNEGPGHFNRACSMLFGGYYFEAIDDPEAWKRIRWANPNIFTRDIARKVVKYGIAIAGDDRMTRKFKILVERDRIEATQIQDIDGFEVISVEQPSEEIYGYYRELAPDLLPVGKVKAKEFRDPARGPYDLTPWEKIDWDAGFAPSYSFEFFVEAKLIALILPGMRFITAVYETSFGMHFYDEVMSVLPSNYLFLYNDWMMEYKEPKPVDWIGDEQEIERRKAEDMVIPALEFSEAEWVLHILANEVKWVPRMSANPEVHAKLIIEALESVGFSMKEIREKLGIVKPPRSKKIAKPFVREETIKQDPVDGPVEKPAKEESEVAIGAEVSRVAMVSCGTQTFIG